MKQYGHFEKNGYKITDRNSPIHQYNYLFNDNYITSISQVGAGQGFAQDALGHRCYTVTERAVYITDSEKVWQANGLPVQRNFQYYHCFHGIGFTEIETSHRAIRTNCRLFVPTEGMREFLSVTIKNEARQTKNIKIIPYCSNLTSDQATTTNAWFSEEKNGIIAETEKSFDGDTLLAYMLSADTVTGYDARRNSFIGPYGNQLQPAAIIQHLGCTNSECIEEENCFVLENSVTLSPGESKTFYYTIGLESTIDLIPQFSAAEIEQFFYVIKEKQKNLTGNIRIHTPWDELNLLSNDWLKYQTALAATWSDIKENSLCKTATGCECLSSFDAALAAQKLCKILSYQYESGQMPPSFTNGTISDKNGAASAAWLIFAAHSVVKELGDIDFLLQKVPFNNGEVASIYEHLKRAVTYLWKNTGHGGLVKIHDGDFISSIDKIGLQEKGSSIWLSIAFVRAAKMLSGMANWIGSEADSKATAYYAQEMEKRINQYGWSEDRYLYAITDDKKFIGADTCHEGAIFALPQIWAVVAEFDPERINIAISTAEKLLSHPTGLSNFTPPFSNQSDYIGTIARKYPYKAENGGICTQTAIWKVVADCILRRNSKLDDDLRNILSHHKATPPYILPEYSSLSDEIVTATADATHLPTVAPQLLYALVHYIFGLKAEFGGLLIRPCLPTSWKDCSISKIFRNCRYNIHYVQKDKGPCNTVDGVFVDGIEVNPNLPIRPQGGRSLNIEVILRT